MNIKIEEEKNDFERLDHSQVQNIRKMEMPSYRIRFHSFEFRFIKSLNSENALFHGYVELLMCRSIEVAH